MEKAMTYQLLAMQFILIGLAGLSFVTLPEAVIPNLVWRAHYAGTFLCFGLEIGIVVGAFLGRSSAAGQST